MVIIKSIQFLRFVGVLKVRSVPDSAFRLVGIFLVGQFPDKITHKKKKKKKRKKEKKRRGKIFLNLKLERKPNPLK